MNNKYSQHSRRLNDDLDESLEDSFDTADSEIIDPLKAQHQFEKESSLSPAPESDLEFAESRIRKHTDDLQMNFFDSLSQVTTGVVGVIDNSWKEAFKPEKNEVNDTWYKKIVDVIGDFFRFIGLVGAETKEWFLRWKERFAGVGVKTGLSSYWLMEKVVPQIADEKSLEVVSKTYENQPENVRKSLDSTVKSAFETYHGYDSGEKSGLIDALQNITDLFSEEKEWSSDDRENLKIGVSFGIDVLYKLKEKFPNNTDFKNILVDIQEYFKSFEGGENKFLNSLNKVLEFRGFGHILSIVYSYVFPNEREKNLITEIVSGAFNLSAFSINVIADREKIKNDLSLYLKDKFKRTGDVTQLLSVLGKMDDVKSGNLDILVELIDVIDKEDLKKIVLAYVDSGSFKQEEFFIDRAIKESLIEQPLESARIVQVPAQAALKGVRAVSETASGVLEFAEDSVEGMSVFFRSGFKNLEIEIKSLLGGNADLIASESDFQKLIAKDEAYLMKLEKKLGKKGFDLFIEKAGILLDDAGLIKEHANRLSRIVELAEKLSTEGKQSKLVQELYNEISLTLDHFTDLNKNMISEANTQIKFLNQAKETRFWQQFKIVAEKQNELIDLERKLLSSVYESANSKLFLKQKFETMGQLRQQFKSLLKSRLELAKLSNETTLKGALNAFKKVPGGILKGAGTLIDSIPLVMVKESVKDWLNDDGEFKDQKLLMDFVDVLPVVGALKIALTDGILEMQFDSHTGEYNFVFHGFESPSRVFVSTAGGAMGIFETYYFLRHPSKMLKFYKGTGKTLLKFGQITFKMSGKSIVVLNNTLGYGFKKLGAEKMTQMIGKRLTSRVEAQFFDKMLKKIGWESLVKLVQKSGVKASLATFMTANDALGIVIDDPIAFGLWAWTLYDLGDIGWDLFKAWRTSGDIKDRFAGEIIKFEVDDKIRTFYDFKQGFDSDKLAEMREFQSLDEAKIMIYREGFEEPEIWRFKKGELNSVELLDSDGKIKSSIDLDKIDDAKVFLEKKFAEEANLPKIKKDDRDEDFQRIGNII